mmetsp:Transcript_39464/g.72801  ORF Transcript_39464/g.72801 Transcript_39464/m.72801 type:complete len:603 (-) Transcript_39464:197-2005(-)
MEAAAAGEAKAAAGDDNDEDTVVVHVHFGMSGAWSVHYVDDEPETKSTTRLRLSDGVVTAHLSAMTCNHGTWDLYTTKRSALGHDPLRSDANPQELYRKISKSKKSIGQIIMDQSYFAGPGNIYRAEILFLAGTHPETPGNVLDEASFDRVWKTSVALLRRGYDTGSILTVDAEVDPEVAARGERRYIYNRSRCARCNGPVKSWDMAGRTCYVCGGGCQPRLSDAECEDAEKVPKNNKNRKTKNTKMQKAAVTPEKKKEQRASASSSQKQHVPFVSHCAPDGQERRLRQHGPAALTKAELTTQIIKMGGESSLPPKSSRKALYVTALAALLAGNNVKEEVVRPRQVTSASLPLPPPTVSAEEAAREKLAAGEHRGVEHIAELSREQAVQALQAATTTNESKNITRVTVRVEGKAFAPPKQGRRELYVENLDALLSGDDAEDHASREKAAAADGSASEGIIDGLTVAEIRSKILELGGESSLPPKRARKALHVEALVALLTTRDEDDGEKSVSSSSRLTTPPAISPEEAAAAQQKAAAWERRGEERISELSRERTTDKAGAAATVTPSPSVSRGENPKKSDRDDDSTLESQQKTRRKRKLLFR